MCWREMIAATWNSECNGGEVESKNGFEEHHNSRGRSRKMRFTEGCREGEPGQRRAEKGTTLYSKSPRIPADLSRKRGSDQVGNGEVPYVRWDELYCTVFHWSVSLGAK